MPNYLQMASSNFLEDGETPDQKESMIFWHLASLAVVLLHDTSFLRLSSSSTSYRSIFTDPSKGDLIHLRIVNCLEMFT